MTDIVLAAQRLLVQDPAFLASGLLASDTTWPQGWIFPLVPGGVIENTGKCAIVLTEDEPWVSPNEHNTAEFTTLVVDIWADPTRNATKDFTRDDAQDKIKALGRIVRQNLHLVQKAVPAGAPSWQGQQGMPRIWGTPTQITNRTGVRVEESTMLSGPQFNPMSNVQNGWRGRFRYGVQYTVI